MLRPALALALLAFATPCLAQTADRPAAQVAAQTQDTREVFSDAPFARNGFVISNDQCGASRYQHLLRENQLAQPTAMPALPDNALIAPSNTARTLEFTPHRLNVVMDENGRIVSIGCY